MSEAVIGFSLPSYLFWLCRGSSSDLVFFEKADLLGNWAPIEINNRLFESSCHILSLPSHKLYQKLNKLGFCLSRMSPQPVKFDYASGRTYGYFLNWGIIRKLLSSIKSRNAKGFLENFNLIFNRFYYFSKGSFEILNKKLPQIIPENISILEVLNDTVILNERVFSKVFLTPGSVFREVVLNKESIPFAFTKKTSVQSLVYIKEPRFDLNYVRVLNNRNVFRISKADYSDPNHFLVAGEWNEELSTDVILEFLRKMRFADSMELIHTNKIHDFHANNRIVNRSVEYIYEGEKNFMNCAAQILN